MKKIFISFSLLCVLAISFFLVKRLTIVSSSKTGELWAKKPQKSSLTFFVLGDTGEDTPNPKLVADAMEKRCEELKDFDGIILLGDNFYMKGVTSTEDPQWGKKILDNYAQKCLKKAPIFPVLGNHDYKGSTDAQINYTALSDQWFMPRRFYGVDFGNLLRLTAIDTAFPDFCFMSESCSLDFLRESLKTSTTKWNIVSAHHPLSSASVEGHSHAGKAPINWFLRKFVCDTKLDLWMSGHAHHLEHRKLENCNPNLIISGGGGGELKAFYKEKETQFAASEFGFVELDVSENELKFTFFSKDLKNLYSKSIYK